MMVKSVGKRKREIKWIGWNDLAGKYPPLMVTDATISITLLGSAHIIEQNRIKENKLSSIAIICEDIKKNAQPVPPAPVKISQK